MRSSSDRTSSSLPHFRPALDEWSDFTRCMARLLAEPSVRAAGAFKVTPPAGWARAPMSKADYDAVRFPIVTPMRQHVAGRRGTYALNLVDVETVSSRALALAAPISPVAYGDAAGGFDALCDHFWKNLRFSDAPVYGADQRGSLLDGMDCGEWNLQHLDTPLQVLPCEIAGVSSPMLYFGTYGSMFAWHTEDVDLAALNYLHSGEPKVWYTVPPSAHRKMTRAFKTGFATDYRECAVAHRHKTFFLAPNVLKDAGVPFTRTIQMPGEFIVVAPKTFHAGFNCGYNIAESVNFLPPGDEWWAMGCAASQCFCSADNVHFQVAALRRAAEETIGKACAALASGFASHEIGIGTASASTVERAAARVVCEQSESEPRRGGGGGDDGDDGDDGDEGGALELSIGSHVDVFAAERWWVARVETLRAIELTEAGSAARRSAPLDALVLARVRLLGQRAGAPASASSASASAAAARSASRRTEQWLALLPHGARAQPDINRASARIRAHSSLMVPSCAATETPLRSMGGSRSMAARAPESESPWGRTQTPASAVGSSASASASASESESGAEGESEGARARALEAAAAAGAARAPKRRKRVARSKPRAARKKQAENKAPARHARAPTVLASPTDASSVIAAQLHVLNEAGGRGAPSGRSASGARSAAGSSSAPQTQAHVLPPALTPKQAPTLNGRGRPKREWRCSMCTLANAGAQSVCGACGGERRYCAQRS